MNIEYVTVQEVKNTEVAVAAPLVSVKYAGHLRTTKMGFYWAISVASLFIAVCCFFLQKYSFWSSRGVPGPRPSPLFGNVKDLVLGRVATCDFIKKLYDQHSDGQPYIGFYKVCRPVLVVKDPEYIKDVLVKDFAVFPHRGFRVPRWRDPLKQHLFALEAAQWRPLRALLTPTFTSARLRDMFPLMAECAEQLDGYVTSRVAQSTVLECRELAARFTTDVIGVCAFGQQLDALVREDSPFRAIGRQFVAPSSRNFVSLRIREMFPWLTDVYTLLFAHKAERDNFFINSVVQTMEHRKRSGVRRNDFVDLLVDMERDSSGRVGDIGNAGH